ncbi:MAG: hypothetical protein ACRDHJ_05205 [Actinomycetota bacterium]
MQTTEVPEPESPQANEAAAIGDVLRWLIEETEAESGAFILLTPSGAEHLLLEPRGLSTSDVAELVEQARHAMVEGTVEVEVNVPMAHARWLGRNGSKIVILRGVTAAAGSDALRFARFVIEWLTVRGEDLPPSLEQRVREIPGVSWAEMSPGDPPTLRVLLDPNGDTDLARHELARTVGDESVRIEEIDGGTGAEEPRIRLIDLTVGLDDESSVDVVLDWRGQMLRGRGRGQPTEAGRSFASAQAVADAMKPLLDTDVTVEGVYRSDAADGLDVLVVTVRVGSERYVGAVTSPKGQETVSGARAVLDALNRRLAQIAGKAGRI